jgi:hypothetical protein
MACRYISEHRHPRSRALNESRLSLTDGLPRGRRTAVPRARQPSAKPFRDRPCYNSARKESQSMYLPKTNLYVQLPASRSTGPA